QAWQRGRSRRPPADFRMQSSGEKAARHLLSAMAPLRVAAVCNAFSKMKTVECFDSDSTTLLRLNLRAGNHRPRERAAYKNIRRGRTAAPLRCRHRRDV